MSRDRRHEALPPRHRARRHARPFVAALLFAFAGCGGVASTDEPYAGPAGRLFPPDVEPVERGRPPDVPSEGRPSQSPGAPGDGASFAAPTPVRPAPAAPPAYAPPPPARAEAPPAVAASSPAPPAAAPATPASRLAAAAPPEPQVVERRIYRADGEKVGNELELRIERLWLENGFTFAQIHVKNTSRHELEEVTIKCTAFGRRHVNLEFREQPLLTRADGPMRPGFQKSLKIRLERAGMNVREMSCSAKGW